MSALSLPFTRRILLAGAAATGALGALSPEARAHADGEGIRPFRVDIPDDAITGLRRRLAAARRPERETVADQSQGVRQEVRVAFRPLR